MRPIDADKLEYKEVIEPMRDRDGMIYPLHYLVVKKTDIMCAPTLDVALAKHGKWIPVERLKDDEISKCSACGDYWTGTRFYRYCPNCGAKMDGRQVDDLS